MYAVIDFGALMKIMNSHRIQLKTTRYNGFKTVDIQMLGALRRIAIAVAVTASWTVSAEAVEVQNAKYVAAASAQNVGYNEIMSARSGSIVAIRTSDANPFNALVGKRRVRKSPERKDTRVQRYVVADGERSFLFQGIDGQARIQFLCGKGDERIECKIDPDQGSAEIISLVLTRAPRGDIIYKSADGDTVLRIASYGGATVWWPGEDKALAASRSFSDRITLALPLVGERTVVRRAARASALLSAITGEPIYFDAGVIANPVVSDDIDNPDTLNADVSNMAGTEEHTGSESLQVQLSENQETVIVDTNSEADSFEIAGFSERDNDDRFRTRLVEPVTPQSAVLADSIVTTSKGMAAVAADPTGARIIGTRLKSVRFMAAQTSSMSLNEQIFLVRYNPALGLQGRPTSAEIARFLEENL